MNDGNRFDVDYDMLPEYMREPAKRYVEDGDLPGRFLQAVLQNDFVQVVFRADDINGAMLKDWAMWVYNECPSQAWGSQKKMFKWSRERKG